MCKKKKEKKCSSSESSSVQHSRTRHLIWLLLFCLSCLISLLSKPSHIRVIIVVLVPTQTRVQVVQLRGLYFDGFSRPIIFGNENNDLTSVDLHCAHNFAPLCFDVYKYIYIYIFFFSFWSYLDQNPMEATPSDSITPSLGHLFLPVIPLSLSCRYQPS